MMDFLNKQVDLLFGLKLWVILSIALVVLILLIVIITLIAKSRKKKNMTRNSAEVMAYNVDNDKMRREAALAEDALELHSTIDHTTMSKEEKAIKSEPTVKSQAEEEVVVTPAEKKKTTEEKKSATATKAKTAVAKTTPVTAEKKETEEAPVNTQKSETITKGKYIISKKSSGQYTFSLLASNGTSIFESDEYSSETGARNAIAIFKKNFNDPDGFSVEKTAVGSFIYKIKKGNNSMYLSREYDTEASAQRALNSVQKFYASEAIVIVKNKNS